MIKQITGRGEVNGAYSLAAFGALEQREYDLVGRITRQNLPASEITSNLPHDVSNLVKRFLSSCPRVL